MRNQEFLTIACLISFLFCWQPGFCQSKPASPAQKGSKLYKALNCSMCHTVNEAGGCMGPPLSQVTLRRSDNYLKLRLTASKEDEFIALVKHPELFPHPRFKPQEVDALIAYLKTLSAKPTSKVGHKAVSIADDKPPKAFVPMEATASSREGRRLFLQTGCMSCHSIFGAGGSSAPALEGIGFRRSRSYIEAHITNPQVHLKPAKSKMVQSELMPDQVKNIADFLLTLPKD